jgi:hypothetical protein
MTMKTWNETQEDEVLPAFNRAADGTVAEILGEAGRRQAEMRLSSDERKMLIETRRKAQEKKDKARRKAEAQKANRLHVLLPKQLKKHVQKLAARYRIPVSQVVAFLLYEGLEQHPDGEGFILYRRDSAPPDDDLLNGGRRFQLARNVGGLNFRFEDVSIYCENMAIIGILDAPFECSCIIFPPEIKIPIYVSIV